jgi:hypothetical protein
LQVVHPLEKIFPDGKPGDHFGNHLGDWEHNMIRFVDGEPIGIYFSHHTSGESCAWDDKSCLSTREGRPVVFSARGSHANYPSAGVHIHDEALIDIAGQGRLWDPVSRAWLYTYDAVNGTFQPEDASTPVDWLYFNGHWGDGQYLDDDPRQQTIPYFGLKKYEGGPNGPKYKHLVRQGLEPDEKEKPVLLKKLIHAYLLLYNKGINTWVMVVMLVISVLVTTALCAVGGVWATRKARVVLGHKKVRPAIDEAEVQLRLLNPGEHDDDYGSDEDAIPASGRG